MNSRERRKLAAKEHNDCIDLRSQISEMQQAVRKKHGVLVRIIYGDTSMKMRENLLMLRGMLEADSPPNRAISQKRRIVSGAALAGLAGMGALR